MPLLPKHKNNGADSRISQVINKVLRKIFGDEATLLIYEYLQNRYSLEPDEIVEKIDVFTEGLEEFLRSGAQIIEMEILEDIYSSYGLSTDLELEGSRYDFVSQMRMLTQKA